MAQATISLSPLDHALQLVKAAGCGVMAKRKPKIIRKPVAPPINEWRS
jgi:hypothetical protein